METKTKAKYAVINDDKVIAIFYTNEDFGNTLVIMDKINANSDMRIFDIKVGVYIYDQNMIDFMWSILPVPTN